MVRRCINILFKFRVEYQMCIGHPVWIAIPNLQHIKYIDHTFLLFFYISLRCVVNDKLPYGISIFLLSLQKLKQFSICCRTFCEWIRFHSHSFIFKIIKLFFSMVFLTAFSICRHPLFSLLALMLEKCEQATQGYIPKATSASPNGTNGNTDSDSFTKDIQAFVQMLEKENRPLLTNNAELDGLVSAIEENTLDNMYSQ